MSTNQVIFQNACTREQCLNIWLRASCRAQNPNSAWTHQFANFRLLQDTKRRLVAVLEQQRRLLLRPE